MIMESVEMADKKMLTMPSFSDHQEAEQEEA
ncbi:hypothetical protein A2U01_0100940, partial [Trifolium medium]|nr:hypothetical protein [Trifolium medium]